MLEQGDRVFRTKFRQKLKLKFENTDIKQIEDASEADEYTLTFQEAIDIMKAFRNTVHEYQIWLKVDLLLQNAIISDPQAKNISKNDLMDVINTLAFKEVQSIETWQFLTTLLIGKFES